MLFKFIDQKIRRAFSNSAMQYEMFAQVQKEIGRDLMNKMAQKENPSHILDVGMGTGWMTQRLHLFYPEARIVGIDFAFGMLQKAKEKEAQFDLLQAQAEALPFRHQLFDVIISNLAYQWVSDLNKAFHQNYECLKDGGLFCATLFGQKTLNELFTALEVSWEGDKKIPLPIQRLPDQSHLQEALVSSGFKSFTTDSEMIKVHFTDMFAIIQWLKEIGANALPKEVFIGRDWLHRANEYYKENFKDEWGVSACFEVIWIKAEK